jgi:hypothetical protein
MRALLSTSSCRFYCLSRQEHIETFLLRTKLTRRVIAVADIGARRRCCSLACSQDRLRSRLISAARLGRSFSLTALNFNPSPPPGFTCRTTALARICPSWTRKWRLAVAPRRFVLEVSMNNPPALRFFTRDRSLSPVHSQ